MLSRTLLLLSAAASVFAQGVTFDRILNARKEPQNWLTYSGTVDGQRYSASHADHPGQRQESGAAVGLAGTLHEKFETTALVVDGVLYTIQAPNDVYALDAVTGRIFWTLPYPPAPEARRLLRTRQSRPRHSGRHAVHGHLDAHVLAIDAKTGKIIWNTTVGVAAQRGALSPSPTLR